MDGWLDGRVNKWQTGWKDRCIVDVVVDSWRDRLVEEWIKALWIDD